MELNATTHDPVLEFHAGVHCEGIWPSLSFFPVEVFSGVVIKSIASKSSETVIATTSDRLRLTFCHVRNNTSLAWTCEKISWCHNLPIHHEHCSLGMIEEVSMIGALSKISFDAKTRDMLQAMEPHIQSELYQPWRGSRALYATISAGMPTEERW